MDSRLINTIKTYDSTAEDYVEKTDNLLQRDRLNEFISCIGKQSGRVIDLGCGPGRDAEYLYNQGFNVVGMDLSSELLNIARKRVPGGFFFNLDITSNLAGLWRANCDGVWASASLVHVPLDNLFYTVGQVRDMLKPNGVFYARIMEGSGAEVRVSKRYGSVPGGEKFWQYFTEKTFAKALFANSFDVLNVYLEQNEFSPKHPWMDFFARKKGK
ncbi:MAG: class I SAM-dependent methyltransferase [archaeon]